MTNTDKFLKDGVDIQELAQELEQAVYKRTGENLSKVFVDFFNKKISTLTEDERVILRNIDKKFIKIGRDKSNVIYFIFVELFMKKEVKYYASIFDNVFQFIKEGEEYEIKELLNEDI